METEKASSTRVRPSERAHGRQSGVAAVESEDREEACGATVDPVVLPDDWVAGRQAEERQPRSFRAGHLGASSGSFREAVSLRKISSSVSLPERAYAFLISPSVPSTTKLL